MAGSRGPGAESSQVVGDARESNIWTTFPSSALLAHADVKRGRQEGESRQGCLPHSSRPRYTKWGECQMDPLVLPW